MTGRTIPPILYGQYGASIGGPIIKDKLFFFGDYQATRSKIGSSFLQSIPSDRWSARLAAWPGSANCDLSEYAQSRFTIPTTGVQADGTRAERTLFVPATLAFPNSQPFVPAGCGLAATSFPTPTSSGLAQQLPCRRKRYFQQRPVQHSHRRPDYIEAAHLRPLQLCQLHPHRCRSLWRPRWKRLRHGWICRRSPRAATRVLPLDSTTLSDPACLPTSASDTCAIT